MGQPLLIKTTKTNHNIAMIWATPIYSDQWETSNMESIHFENN